MKRKFTYFGVTTLFATFAMAQLPVSTTPQNKKVVLEEFTGINCQYCPDGHKIANNIKASKPAGDVILVNIHTGGYANPSAGQPDYRTADGNAIAAIPGMGITGYPTGSLNRMVMTPTAIACSRSTWAGHANTILSQTSAVNVALQGTLNIVTRVLTAVAEVYYTANSATPQNSLTIAILEDDVVGPQVSGAIWNPAQTNPDGTYNHQHMLRDVITAGSLGITIPTTTVGTTFTTMVTYTVPTTFGAGTATNSCNLGELELIAFVANSSKEIQTAAYGPITLTGFANSIDAAMNTTKVETEVCFGKINPEFKFLNNGSSTITTAVFAYKVNGSPAGTYTWTGSASPLSYKTFTVPTINFTPSATNTLEINVVSVNGSGDQNSINDINLKTIPTTTNIALDLNMTMNFKQDQWGTESSWQFIDEATNGVISSDGPFTDLGAAGTAMHTKTFTILPNNCYVLKVADAYGDGINAGYGTGNYSLLSGVTTIITSNGMYGKGENRWAKTTVTSGINAKNNSNSDFFIYPNPSNGQFNLNVKNINEDVNLIITNTLGQNVFNKTISAENLANETVNTNLSTGVYYVSVKSASGTFTKKLTIKN